MATVSPIPPKSAEPRLVGAQLRSCMAARGMTPREFANAIGVSYTHCLNLLNDKKAATHELCTRLGLNLGGESEPQSSKVATIAKRLHQLMGSRGWKAADLIEASGLSRSFIYAVLAGEKTAMIGTYEVLARTLGVDTGMLLADSDSLPEAVTPSPAAALREKCQLWKPLMAIRQALGLLESIEPSTLTLEQLAVASMELRRVDHATAELLFAIQQAYDEKEQP